ncbi:MAG: B12-binding domain-containing radical SAM protein, partial [Candidatus Hydrogenedentota bacterium]
MKIGFYVQAHEHIGVEILTAVLKQAGHSVEVFFDPKLCRDGTLFIDPLASLLNVEDMVIEDVLEADLDMLCFSVVTDNYASSLRVARKIKEHSNIPTVFGGVHCSSVPERVVNRPEVDYLVVGEGEYPLTELAEALANGQTRPNIMNVWYQDAYGQTVSHPTRPTIPDLDVLPFLDRDPFLEKVPAFHRTRYSTAASRGCVYACTFCNNSMYKTMYNKAKKGRWKRRRSVDNFMEELRLAHAKYNFAHAFFQDEIFIDDREWLEEFCDKYARDIGKPFWCYGYAKFIDKGVVEMLEHANCKIINIGIQTVRESTKKKYLKRGERYDKIVDSIELFKHSNIRLTTGNILECPGQTIDEAIELAEFYNDNRVDLPIVGFLRYYPRTEIVDIAKQEGILEDADIEDIEEARDERPILVSDNKNGPLYRKASNLILLTIVLPKSMVRWL